VTASQNRLLALEEKVTQAAHAFLILIMREKKQRVHQAIVAV
jgi:hypothetical protein